MILDLLSTLVLVALLGLFVIGMLSPLESLRWWAGWSDQPAAATLTGAVANPEKFPDPIVVYLSGIGSISGDELLSEEANFLDVLEPLLPGGVIVRDVFPYSASGVGLTGTRTFAHFWRFLGRIRVQGDVLLSSLINVRNLFQVAVATDPRYGPIFATGVAQAIEREVSRVGFLPNGAQRVVLLGYSGGAQVAVGAAPFLKRWLGVPVHVISLGGVLDSDPGLSAVQRLDHLVGDRDIMEKIGRTVYPGRWRIARNSAWNRARKNGVVQMVRLPGMAHNTPGGYMDPNARSAAGDLNPQLTAQAIATALGV